MDIQVHITPKGASDSKGKYVRVSPYYSVEFRIGRLTYDYSTIIRYIIECSDLVRRCKTDYLNHKSIDKSELIPTDEITYSHNYVHRSGEDLEISIDTAIDERMDLITRSIGSLSNVQLGNTTSNSVWYTAGDEDEYHLYS